MSDIRVTINEQELNRFRTVLNAGSHGDSQNSCGRGPIYTVPDGNRKCVIMLALSVYLGRYTASAISYGNASYAVNGRDVKEYTGAYQLEVVPQYVMKELAAQDINDVEFIILETDEVHTRQDTPVTLGGRQYVTLTSDGFEANPTEAEAFICRMLEYAGDDLAARNLNLHFVEYYLSDNPRKDMPNLLDLVRAEAGFASASAGAQCSQNADIYIDIHGGPRATQQLLINLLSILGEEGITINPDNIFTVDGKDAPIAQAGESFRINDFVSGIHEFVHHGISLHKETLIHSDQGSHYSSTTFIRIIEDYEFRRSMSRRGNCWDNAPQESFFGHMKDHISGKVAACTEFSQVKDIIDDYIDYYNNEDYVWELCKLSPNEYYRFVTTGIYPLAVKNPPAVPVATKRPEELGQKEQPVEGSS